MILRRICLAQSSRGGQQITKDKFETTAEFHRRLDSAVAPVKGREFTFLVPSALVNVMAYPDKGFYIIGSTSVVFKERSDPEVVIDSAEKSSRQYEAQNAFGAKTVVKQHNYVQHKLTFKVPRGLFWKGEDDYYPPCRFGLPIRIKSDEYRQLLRDNKLAFAIRIIPDRIDQATRSVSGLSPTIDVPVGTVSEDYTVKCKLIGAWVVRLDRDLAVEEWVEGNNK